MRPTLLVLLASVVFWVLVLVALDTGNAAASVAAALVAVVTVIVLVATKGRAKRP